MAMTDATESLAAEAIHDPLLQPPPLTQPPIPAAPAIPAKAPRLAQFDVARAIVLLGVFTMNYIVNFNIKLLRETGWDGLDAPDWLKKVLDTNSGPLSTRFAATLVTLVGMGITFLSRSAVASKDPVAIDALRWRLRRRGALFILTGIFFDNAWPGTILHFTGTYLILCSFIVTWRRRSWLLSAGIITALTVVQRIIVFQTTKNDEPYTSWWSGFRYESRMPVGTVQGFISNITTWGGHPILPWLAFVLVGMCLATLNWTNMRTYYLVGVLGLGFIGLGYLVRYVGRQVLHDEWMWTASIDPGAFQRKSPFGLGMPAYVLAGIGSSITAIALFAGFAFRFPRFLPVRVLARAGRVTFSLYILHGLIPWALMAFDVDKRSHGLVESLVIAFVAWFAAVSVGAIWQKYLHIGPMEWLLRKFGG
jgi:uncharacterized protein